MNAIAVPTQYSEMIRVPGLCEACGVQATQLQPDLIRRGSELSASELPHRFCDRHEFSDLLRTTTF